jgi:preprotein translocase subunit Sec63
MFNSKPSWVPEQNLSNCKEIVEDFIQNKEKTDSKFYICRRLPNLVSEWIKRGVDEIQMESFFTRMEAEITIQDCAKVLSDELTRVQVGHSNLTDPLKLFMLHRIDSFDRNCKFQIAIRKDLLSEVNLVLWK